MNKNELESDAMRAANSRCYNTKYKAKVWFVQILRESKSFLKDRRPTEREKGSYMRRGKEINFDLYTFFSAWLPISKNDLLNLTKYLPLVEGASYLGRMSQPWPIRLPRENQRQLTRLNLLSNSSQFSLHGWGFSHSNGVILHSVKFQENTWVGVTRT